MDTLLTGLLIGTPAGGIIGFVVMAAFSGRAYDKGLKDAFRGDYHEGIEEGYRMALADFRTADEVVFEGPDHTRIEGD